VQRAAGRNYRATKGAMRNFHALSQAKVLEKAHGYCVFNS
jgi:hypothetical protein